MSQEQPVSQERPAEREAPAAQDAAGPLGYVVGVAVGLAALLGLWLITRGGPASPLPAVAGERAHLAVLVEFDDLNAVATRQALRDLELALGKLPLRGVGPGSLSVLMPPADKDKDPQGEEVGPKSPRGEEPKEPPRNPLNRDKREKRGDDGLPTKSGLRLPRRVPLDTSDPSLWLQARDYLAMGGYAAPRCLGADGKSALIRAWPATGEGFEAGLGERVRAVLEQHRGAFKGLFAYSRALGLTDAEAKARINREYGVQIVRVALTWKAVPEAGLFDADLFTRIHLKANEEHPQVLTRACVWDFYLYAEGVRRRVSQGELLVEPKQLVVLRMLERESGPALMDEAQRTTWVEFGTTAEGPANQALEQELSQRLATVEGMVARPDRPPQAPPAQAAQAPPAQVPPAK